MLNVAARVVNVVSGTGRFDRGLAVAARVVWSMARGSSTVGCLSPIFTRLTCLSSACLHAGLPMSERPHFLIPGLPFTDVDARCQLT